MWVHQLHDPTDEGVGHHWWVCDVWSHQCVTTVSSHHWCLLVLEEDGATHSGCWVFYFEPCFHPESKLCILLCFSCTVALSESWSDCWCVSGHLKGTCLLGQSIDHIGLCWLSGDLKVLPFDVVVAPHFWHGLGCVSCVVKPCFDGLHTPGLSWTTDHPC